MIYCFFLAVGIYISTLRQQRRGQANLPSSTPGTLITLGHLAGVWTFFALLNLWDPRAISTMPQRVEFFFSLFGF